MPTTTTTATATAPQGRPQSIPGGVPDAHAEAAQDERATAARAWQDDPETREAMIRLAAYSFYERRGFVDGQELEDWLQAEIEIDRRAAAGADAGGVGATKTA
jgi:hypothetical protein